MAQKHITKAFAEAKFRKHDLPYLVRGNGKRDKTAIRCAWNDYVDALNKSGYITDRQAYTWTNPFK